MYVIDFFHGIHLHRYYVFIIISKKVVVNGMNRNCIWKSNFRLAVQFRHLHGTRSSIYLTAFFYYIHSLKNSTNNCSIIRIEWMQSFYKNMYVYH